jgi:hypothetical protein
LPHGHLGRGPHAARDPCAAAALPPARGVPGRLGRHFHGGLLPRPSLQRAARQGRKADRAGAPDGGDRPPLAGDPRAEREEVLPGRPQGGGGRLPAGALEDAEGGLARRPRPAGPRRPGLLPDHGRHGGPALAAVLALLLRQPVQAARLRTAPGRLGVDSDRARERQAGPRLVLPARSVRVARLAAGAHHRREGRGPGRLRRQGLARPVLQGQRAHPHLRVRQRPHGRRGREAAPRAVHPRRGRRGRLGPLARDVGAPRAAPRGRPSRPHGSNPRPSTRTG